MKKFLLPAIVIAIALVPATADAAQCRNSATGKFAKCGTAGAVPASQYVAKGKSAKSATPAAPAAPAAAAAPAKSGKMAGMLGLMKPKPKVAPAPAKPAKPARCKTAKGKFVKCGTPGATPG
ncbi:MAG: hypothetical protein KGK11_05675 [Sphingomonadales bacterium]|nr:hypothetical protein [Sphingomonadales bacterium]